MTYMIKPKITHPSLKKNSLGLTVRDYEGVLSTLCAGCGHDSITAAIVQACYELDLPPHTLAKTSGIGCSSKTPAYFLSPAHGFNSVHGRMPSVTTGANLAHRELSYLGVSGDGDSISIGLGQFVHAMRRKVNMLYIIENNGTYGLTKGQFSATSDQGSKTKKGEANPLPAIDPVILALQMGASFVARSFSGDKSQLIPLIKAGLKHKGFALIDVISPCVTFNNHEGSTKSYDYVRAHNEEVTEEDLFDAGHIPLKSEITAEQSVGKVIAVTLHDGSVLQLKSLIPDIHPADPQSRVKMIQYIEEHRQRGEILTGLLHIEESRHGVNELHDVLNTVSKPLRNLSFAELCPGSQALKDLQKGFR